MRIGVLGASGFIGRHLCTALRERGDSVITASLRDPGAAAGLLRGCDAVVNLAGESVAQRWTAQVKADIEQSRTDAVARLFDALARETALPARYISASACGYYGTSETVTFTETSLPGTDFLAIVCARWEEQAQRAHDLGMRVACIRTGLALGSDGGALQKMLPAFRLGAGGRIGDGKQWHSWIHIADVVGIYLMAIDGVDGVLNATAPNPVRNEEFTKALGAALHRPTFLSVPGAAIATIFGEGAYVFTEGQRVLPERTRMAGYTFAFTEIGPALAHLI